MNVSLYQAAAALNANARWQELISENLASSAIPGYKKKDLAIAAVEAGLLPAGALDSQGRPAVFALPKATAAVNFLPGEMRVTGVKTDVAIDGPGFFEVQLPDGSSAHTRDGEFHINAQGQLVTKEGYLVMGETGPIQIDPRNSAELSISATGEVTQGIDRRGKLKLMEFDDPKLLRQITGGYFLADDPNLNGAPSTRSTLRQGFLETANVSTVTEMANLMTAMRTFEANQRIIQLQDERIGRVINELGNPS